MSRKFSSILLILVLISMTIFTAVPAQAQDGEELAPCTAEELAQIEALVIDGTTLYGEAGLAAASVATAEDLVNLAIAYETASTYLHTEVLPQMPDCIDGKLMSLMLIDQLDVASLTNALIAVGASESETDPEGGMAFIDLGKVFAAYLVESQEYMTSTIVNIKAGTAMEEWLPACTEEELAQESVAENDAYLTRYFEEIEPAFNEDFSDDGVISDDNLLLMAQSVDELNKLDEELPACEPVFSKSVDIYRLYLESSLIALYMRLSSIDGGPYAEAIGPLSMARLGWATEELFEPYRPVEEAE